jgi:hypothetical protein
MPRRKRRPTRQLRNAALALVAGGTALAVAPHVAQVQLADVPRAIVEAPAGIAEIGVEAVSQVAYVSAAATGQHLGFDTHTYPGDRAMARWKDAAPYEWVGYYLPAAPCHESTSWSGKRETLERMGWGIAVIYVGQQTCDGVKAPPVSQARRKLASEGRACHKAFVTSERGAA